MAKRGRTKGFTMPEEHRDKIAKSNILNRLVKFCNGELEMAPHQVTAALGLLRKVLPDLASQEITLDTATPFALIPEVIQDDKQWETGFAPSSKTEH